MNLRVNQTRRFLSTLLILLLPACGTFKETSSTTFTAIDIETTGLNHRKDKIIEIAAVKFRNGEILESRNWLINPNIPIPKEIQDLTGITPQMMKDAPSFKEVYPEFIAFIETSVLLAHNAGFDMRFMTHKAEKDLLMSAPANRVIDTLRLSRYAFPDRESHALEELRKDFEINTGNPHRALSDSTALFYLFQKCIKELPDHELDNFFRIAEYRYK